MNALIRPVRGLVSIGLLSLCSGIVGGCSRDAEGPPGTPSAGPERTAAEAASACAKIATEKHDDVTITEAVEHAGMAKDAGAAGLLVMPPHYWLRFGMRPEYVMDHFTAIGRAVDINLIVHIYPAWTKASYSSDLLAELARLPWVTTFKIGTREMSKYDRDIRAIRDADPNCTILTCHDEYILTSMVQGIDGALVGFASFIPDLIVDLYQAVCDGDLKRAQKIQNTIYQLKAVVYDSDEPSGDAHARMKSAMVMAGRLKSDITRPPIQRPGPETLVRIRQAVESVGLLATEPVLA